MGSNGRRGSAPKHDPVVKPASVPTSASNGYPILCLRHLQDKFGIDQLDAQQCQEFLKKWHKRAKLTWNELNQHGKYGLGSEKLPKSAFKPCIPEQFEQDKYMVFRHAGNQPFAGFRAGDVFHVLWIEANWNELYDHGRR